MDLNNLKFSSEYGFISIFFDFMITLRYTSSTMHEILKINNTDIILIPLCSGMKSFPAVIYPSLTQSPIISTAQLKE